MKPAPSSRRVAAAITTCPEPASACSRAARLGVAPTTACSCAAPSPTRSPTTTRPVAIPTRAASPSPAGSAHVADCFRRGKSGANGTFGIVLVGVRPAEIGEYAVPHKFGDMPADASDLARDCVLVSAQHIAHRLGIEPGRESGRVGEIDEHHRNLAPFGFVARRRRAAAPQARQCRQQFAARTQRHAELSDIVLGQQRQDLDVDLVLGEYRREFRQPVCRQPRKDVGHTTAPARLNPRPAVPRASLTGS